MYTWGDLQETVLAKLDLIEDEAEVQGLITRFAYFANEAMTQICSAIKPKATFFEVEINDNNIFTKLKMPEDFISFGDDINKIVYSEYGQQFVAEAHDDDFEYLGYNELLFKKRGKFYISYNARWIGTFVGVDPSLELAGEPYNIPRDILDCLPSYIASQCMKIDDEYKSSVYRNEYEIFLARIDDTNYKNTKTFKIEGDW